MLHIDDIKVLENQNIFCKVSSLFPPSCCVRGVWPVAEAEGARWEVQSLAGHSLGLNTRPDNRRLRPQTGITAGLSDTFSYWTGGVTWWSPVLSLSSAETVRPRQYSADILHPGPS